MQCLASGAPCLGRLASIGGERGQASAAARRADRSASLLKLADGLGRLQRRAKDRGQEAVRCDGECAQRQHRQPLTARSSGGKRPLAAVSAVMRRIWSRRAASASAARARAASSDALGRSAMRDHAAPS